MSGTAFAPTAEQARIIGHAGSAFVAACPGSGKTRVLVERAHRLLADRSSGRGIAFLSFTIAAVSELEQRLRRERLLGTAAFPHFIGTFDGFLWQFLIAPFGIPGCTTRLRMVPDKQQYEIRPFPKAQPLPLECFDRLTGTGIPEALERHRFTGRNIKPYETSARSTRSRLLARGELDFADVRDFALARVREPACSLVLRRALKARFQELVVDEAQDCNPADLEIINWFRAAGIAVKVICDPHQSIYSFRGGVTHELFAFASTFDAGERYSLTGNFRSSEHITKAIVTLRARDTRGVVDDALGPYREEPVPVHILAYPGTSVPSTIGERFNELIGQLGLEARDCPILAATRLSGANALGHPVDSAVKNKDLTCRLAMALSEYHFSFELGGRKEALEGVHKIMVEVEGHTAEKTYHQHIKDANIEPGSWRPRALSLIASLRYDPLRFATAEAWLEEARRVLAPLLPTGGASIKQRLRRNRELGKVFSCAPPSGHAARTIHSVKGMEFSAVCVVLSSTKAKGIVDFLSNGDPASSAEEARKLYVGASRAQRLLAIAAPKSQAKRLLNLIKATGAAVSLAML
jgi:DNA helicase-2/ATP-dependent DNA helicase PcrA